MWEVEEVSEASEPVRRLSERLSSSEQTGGNGPPLRQTAKKKPPPLKALSSFNSTMEYMALGKSSRKMEEASHPGKFEPCIAQNPFSNTSPPIS